MADRPVEIAIIGAGMSGLCMALELRREGIDSFTIFEKAAELGGTWRENTYPGLTCDVPSPAYAYSFAPNPEWSHGFATGGEIHRYLRRVADDHGVRERIRFGTEVVAAEFDEDAARWRLRLGDGSEHVADVVVAATGILHHPNVPRIPGLESFAGPAFHSARWDHEAVVDGARVGVVGSGSTGVQIVTALSGRARSVSHFARTPQWVLPWPNWPYSRLRRAVLRRSRRLNDLIYDRWQRLFDAMAEGVIEPGWKRRLGQGLCRAHLRTVRDPELRRRLTPDYEPGCKRLVVSAGYYRAVQRPSVEVVDAGIDHVEARGIVTADGRLHELDVLVLATGFDAHAYVAPMEVVGEGGTTLAQAWAGGPRAHCTVAVPGFPNLFLLQGPFSPIGNTSLVPVAESQAGFVLHWIRRMRRGDVRTVAPTAEATERFVQEIRGGMPGTVWVTGCGSWYLGPDGTPILWPFRPERFHAMLAQPDERDYVVRTDAPRAVPAAA